MCLDAAEAVISDDRRALELMAGRWDAFGSPALAVECFARSAVAYEHGGYRPAARRCRTAALDRLGQVEAQPPLGRIPSATQPLTLREREVASLAAGGLTNAEIAGRLGLSVRTVHTHLQVVYQKVGVNRRDALSGLLG
jgi:DNA-binding CsgD family transcriptional regulator